MGSSSVRISIKWKKNTFSIFSDESIPKFSDYRPVFFDGRAIWIQETSTEPPQPVRPTERTTIPHPFTQFDERQQTVWTSARVCLFLRSFLKFLVRLNLAIESESSYKWFSSQSKYDICSTTIAYY